MEQRHEFGWTVGPKQQTEAAGISSPRQAGSAGIDFHPAELDGLVGQCRQQKGRNMGQPGIGVMIGMLSGNAKSVKAFASAVGKTIAALRLGEDDALHFEFSDGSKLKLYDDGQSCCEQRYMRTDDNLSDYIGAKLLGAEIKDAPSIPDEYGEHEVQFLDVKTDKGVFTMSSHNEHNGYYGGFWIVAAIE